MLCIEKKNFLCINVHSAYLKTIYRYMKVYLCMQTLRIITANINIEKQKIMSSTVPNWFWWYNLLGLNGIINLLFICGRLLGKYSMCINFAINIDENTNKK